MRLWSLSGGRLRGGSTEAVTQATEQASRDWCRPAETKEGGFAKLCSRKRVSPATGHVSDFARSSATCPKFGHHCRHADLPVLIGKVDVTRSAEPIGSAKPAPRRDPRNTVSRAQPYRCGTP